MKSNEMFRQISMSQPDIHADDIALVVQALKSNRLSLGPFLDRFERAFAAYIGTDHAVAVSSGTAGLHLCICAAEIGPGDEVITTPFSFVASTNCILYERAKPIFVDIDESSLNIDPRLIDAAVTDRSRAILPVHVFGQPCAMDELAALSHKHDLVMIEDACEAIGAEFRGRRVGTFGKAAVFGFYPNKQMTMGEGGIITTNDAQWAALFRGLRNQGRNEMGTWLCHERLGFNYRLDEMSAALGLSQLSRIDELLDRRSKVASIYDALLRAIPGVTLLSASDTTTRLSWFVLIVRLDENISRDSVINYLQNSRNTHADLFLPHSSAAIFQRKIRLSAGSFSNCRARRQQHASAPVPFQSFGRRYRVRGDQSEYGCRTRYRLSRAPSLKPGRGLSMTQTSYGRATLGNEDLEIIVYGGPQVGSFAGMLRDFTEGVRRYDYWHSLAWNDIKARYRRSWLGEFWMAINLAIFVLSVGTVYGVLLNMRLSDYLPQLTIGYAFWLLFSSLTIEGCQTFILGTAILHQQRVPLTAFVFRNVDRAFITFAHNMVVVVIVSAYSALDRIGPSCYSFLALFFGG